MNECFGKNEKLIYALAYLDPRRFDEIESKPIFSNGTLNFLVEKANINYNDLQEELCHFSTYYKTIVKTTQPLSKNIPHPFINQISDSNSETE